MGEYEPALLHKIWAVKYGRGFFRFRSKCPGCGLKTRKQVYHVVSDPSRETRKGGSYHFICLSSTWHRWCHDQLCQHDFCVKQRRRHHGNTFGARIADVVNALDEMIKTADVPKFLSSPHLELNGLNPIHIIWHHNEWGFNKVIQIIEGAASGSFV